MKNLMVIFILIITSSLFAQDKVEDNSTISNKQSDELMIVIAADPDLRIKMMNMMIEETSGDTEEMTQLVNTMYLNPGMQKIMLEKSTESTDNDSFSIEARGTMQDQTKDDKKDYAEPMEKKKYKFPK
jgi:hypothetical protein